MKHYGNTLSRNLCGLLIAVCALSGNLAQVKAGSLIWTNSGSCTATNGRWNYVVVAQQGITGSFNDVGGAFNLVAPGASSVINTFSMSAGQSVTVMLWMTDSTDITPRYQGQYTVSGTNNTTFAYMPRTCDTNSVPKTKTVSVGNTSSMVQEAFFNKDGVMVYSVRLAPGQSVTYTYSWNSPPDPVLNWGLRATAPSIFGSSTSGWDIKVAGQTNDTTFDLSSGGTNQGNAGVNTFDAQTNTFFPVYGDMPNYNATTLTNPGAINWNNPDTTAARDATLKAGFNKVSGQLDSLINGEVMIRDAILEAATEGGGSNSVSVVVTNSGGMTSNDWRGFHAESVPLLTNATSTVLGYTNLASAVVDNWDDMGATSLGALSVPEAGEFSVTLPIGTSGLDFAINSATLPNHSVFSLARTLVKWGVVILTWFAMFKWGEAAMKDVGRTHQVHGSQQAILGTNASLVTGLAYATLIAAAIAAVPLALFALVQDQQTELATAAAAFSSVSTMLGYAAANYIIPLNTIAVGVATYSTYRFVVGLPMIEITKQLIRYFIA